MDPAVASVRMRLAATATLTVVGIGLSVAVDQTLGGYVTMSGIVLLVFSLHRYGRTGPS